MRLRIRAIRQSSLLDGTRVTTTSRTPSTASGGRSTTEARGPALGERGRTCLRAPLFFKAGRFLTSEIQLEIRSSTGRSIWEGVSELGMEIFNKDSVLFR
jgi:hypothetical protein